MTKKDLLDIQDSFKNLLQKVSSQVELEEIKVSFLGKKGKLTAILHQITELSLEEKKVIGLLAHQIQQEIQKLILTKRQEILEIEKEKKLQSDKIDISLPGKPLPIGTLHPISKTLRRIYSIFHSMGFDTVFGPEIEKEYYNFDALNISKNHPARTEADTFFINQSEQIVLRTQTSGVQIRTMEKTHPPLAIISPGRCFRKDEIDATHLPLFHQVEGLVIDQNISFADLKGVLSLFAQQFFGKNTLVRFRPDFFPFTEPSAEVAFSCPVCEGKKPHCSTCHGTGYIEVAGCGLVHPSVIKNGGIDPEQYSGFAFGFGIERLTMIYYGIPDIRLLYENSSEFLNQFSSPIF